MSPTWMRRVMNLWPPFWGAGIRVLMISPDYRRAKVCLKHGLLNRNIVGVHFGGSLFAMTDPFFMLLFSQNLGPDYIIWDQAAKIEFLKPGKGKVHANFVITQDQINHLIAQASSGEKVLQDFVIEVKDMHSHTVARVTKTLYVRKKMK